MDTNKTTTSKRPRTVSDSGNSDSNERISGTFNRPINDLQNQNQNVIVYVESTNVNLSKNQSNFCELVGHVEKVVNTLKGLKIICRKSQANILSKEKKFRMYNGNFTIKSATNKS